MYTLMNETSDIYRDRLIEYADKQEIFNINAYGYFFSFYLTYTFPVI